MLEQLFIEAVRKIVIEELTKHNLEVAKLKAEISDLKQRVALHALGEPASTQTRTDEELTKFIVSTIHNELDIEDFIDERIENALDNSEFIKSDALEDALEAKFDSATIEIRF